MAGEDFLKLSPSTKANQTSVEQFVQDYWDFYGELLAYQKSPTREEAERLRQGFSRAVCTPQWLCRLG